MEEEPVLDYASYEFNRDVVSTLYTYPQEIIFEGGDFKSVKLSKDRKGNPIVKFKLSTIGQAQLSYHLKSNANNYVAIVIDGKVISIPMVTPPKSNGFGYFSGNFTDEEAEELTQLIRSGMLPLEMTFVSSSGELPEPKEERILY